MATVQSAAAARTGWTFYTSMAVLCLLVAVVGFAPTYFVPLASGSFAEPPMVHVHGLLFFAWTLFFVSQTWLVGSGRVLAHRDWGVLGVAIATAMVFSTFVTVVFRINQLTPLGLGESIRAFSWVQVSGMLFFGSAVALAIVKVRSSETHKRLMLLATISLMDAPIARWFATLAAPAAAPGPAQPPPVFVTVPPALLGDLLLVVAMAYDWRRRGRVHTVYIVGGLVLLAIQLTRPLISSTSLWDGLALALGRLGAVS
jgi:hypothetical protein